MTQRKFYIQRGGETYGPYSRDEVIRYLLSRELSDEDLAFTEENQEPRPLKDVLKEQAPTLFTLQQMVEKQESASAEKPSIPVPRAPRRVEEITAPPSWQFPKLAACAALAVFVAVALISYHVFRPSEPPVISSTPASGIAFATPGAGTPVPQINAQASQQATPGHVTQAPSDAGHTAGQQATPVIVAAASPTAVSEEVQPSLAAPPQAPGEAPALAPSMTPAAPAVAAAASPPAAPPDGADMGIQPPPPDEVAAYKESPKGPSIRLHNITMPVSKDITKAEFYYADTVQNPTGVLLLCLGSNENPQLAMNNSDWLQFAKDNNLGLAAVEFASDGKMLRSGGGYYDARAGSGQLLVTALQNAYGRDVPLVVFGHEGGGAFATSFVDWQPARVKLWGVYSKDFPAQPPQPGNGNPPGVIACDVEDLKHNNKRSVEYFEAGRMQGKPWLWIPMAVAQTFRAQRFAEFFQQYAGETLSYTRPNPGVWLGIDDQKKFTKLDLMTKPKSAGWLPDDSLASKWAALKTEELNAGLPTIFERDIPTRNPKMPLLQMFLRLPPYAKSGKDVNGVLAYCTWEDKKNAILEGLGVKGGDKRVEMKVREARLVADIVDFADQNGLAILTWGTEDAYKKGTDVTDMDDAERLREEQGFDLIANAWERGLMQLVKDGGIPTNDYLLYGISRGALWANRLALRKPDYFMAVHIHIPNSYDEPRPEAKNMLWLLTTGELDYGYTGSIRFYKQCRSLGYPIIYKAVVDAGHSDTYVADDLGTQFFEYALSMKKAYDEHMKQAHDFFGSTAQQRAPANEPWPPAFRDPDYFGDLLNQDCYPKDQVQMIAATLRVPLPTKTLADAWNK
jgi:predicted esterase